jgi:hypothetical protein
VAQPAPRLLAAALLAFGLTACTATVPASPHPQYNPPVVPVAADPTEPSTPTTATEATPAARTPVSGSRPTAAAVRGSARQPAIVVIAIPTATPPRPPAVRNPAPQPAPIVRTTVPPPATTRNPVPVGTHPTGPYIDKILAVEGQICPAIYLTGRTADGQPMACRWDGDPLHPATWQPL